MYICIYVCWPNGPDFCRWVGLGFLELKRAELGFRHPSLSLTWFIAGRAISKSITSRARLFLDRLGGPPSAYEPASPIMRPHKSTFKQILLLTAPAKPFKWFFAEQCMQVYYTIKQ